MAAYGDISLVKIQLLVDIKNLIVDIKKCNCWYQKKELLISRM